MTVEEAIVDVFERRSAAALFVTEVQYGIAPQREPEEFAAALARLVERGEIIIVTKPAPDVHLADADLRIAAGLAPLLVSGLQLRIGVDIGGTFTDVTVMDTGDGSVAFGKSLSTPDDLVRGILDAIGVTGRSPRDAEFIIHGSTVAINAILERKGAKTALVTTEGFRDVYEIGRVNRPDSFNLAFRKHVPLIPRALRFEAAERMLYDGSVERPLDEAQARGVAHAVKTAHVESVAVLFLHSYANVAHEERMVELLREALPDAFITASHHVSREQREYERTSTVAANA